MSGLEIALLVFGIACVIISFFIVDNNEKVENSKVAAPDLKAFNELSKKVIDDTNNNAEKVLNDTEEKLEALSNDKIMAVGEYSDQVIEKIDTNHKEVVFLYQMLKDKEEELKNTASELETLRIECEKVLHENKDLSENTLAAIKEAKNLYIDNGALVNTKKTVENVGNTTESIVDNVSNEVVSTEQENVEKATAVAKTNSSAKSSKSSNKARNSVLSNSSSERQYGWGEALAIAEEQQENTDNVSERNQEIIDLYKKNKSVLEISKLLGMGQGEVKLVIDLYCK